MLVRSSPEIVSTRPADVHRSRALTMRLKRFPIKLHRAGVGLDARRPTCIGFAREIARREVRVGEITDKRIAVLGAGANGASIGADLTKAGFCACQQARWSGLN